MALSWSIYYTVGAFGASSYGGAEGYGKGGVVPRKTQTTSQKYDCWIHSGDFV